MPLCRVIVHEANLDVTQPGNPDNEPTRDRLANNGPDAELIRRLFSGADSSFLKQLDEDPLADCPPDPSITYVAAGLIPAAEAEPILRHAARCATCGPLLKMAVESINGELTHEDEHFLRQLQSSQPQFVARFVRRPNLDWRWAAAAALFAVTLSGLVWSARQRFWPESESARATQLLAEAYGATRPFEPRLPATRFANVKAQRGALASSDISLTEARLVVLRALRDDPANPTWLILQGRSELLQGQFDEAIKSLEQALDQRSDPAALADLGCAYLARGDAQNKDAASYRKALESLGRSLQARPNAPEAVYNLALASERLQLVEEASRQWNRYLALDPTGPWAEEARAKLALLQKKKE